MSDFEVRKLRNGVPVLLETYKDGETTTIGISYNVGGRNEWKRGAEYDGISHFLEHVFFLGNENITPKEVNEALDDLGGIDNAFTTEDTTCYFAKVLNTEIFNAIDLWNTLLTFGEISKQDFDKEAFVVKQEFRRFEDNPPFLLQVTLQKNLFKNTSLEMDVLGNLDSLSNVSMKQMEDYRSEHYGLENAILMVLGNFDKEKVFEKLEQTFGTKKVRSDKPKYQLTTYETPIQSFIKVVTIEKDTPLVFFGLDIKTPGGKSEYANAIDILSSYITLGKSSLLQKQLVR
ncbi:MAG: M16 family metallopeptidase, partial [Candidatus Kariarchaeaceae archaeon]